MSSGKVRRGRPISRNSSSASSSNASSLNHSGRIGRRGGQQKLACLPSEPDPERDIYVVEALIKVREPVNPGEERHFFVKWLNYPSSQNSWEPESNLSPDLVVQWERDHSANRQSVISVSSDTSISRPDSKLSVNSETDPPTTKGLGKGKKRLLPTSPKVQTTVQSKNRGKSPPPPIEKSLAPPSVEKSSHALAKPPATGLNAPTRSKLLEVVGSIKPERVVSVYRESDGELCYLIERSYTTHAEENVIPEARKDVNDRLQIVSSQVFDTLWPEDALNYYETQVLSTICLEDLDGVSSVASRTGEGLASAMANTKIESDSSESGDETEEDEFEVERVVDVMYRGNKRLYLLKWVGYSDADNTWETEDSLNCPNLLNEFWVSRPEADPRKKKKVAGGGKNEKNALVPKKPQKIIGFYTEGAKMPVADNNLQSSVEKWRLMIKWQGEVAPEVVPYKEARAKWPMTVIKFFQKYLDG